MKLVQLKLSEEEWNAFLQHFAAQALSLKKINMLDQFFGSYPSGVVSKAKHMDTISSKIQVMGD